MDFVVPMPEVGERGWENYHALGVYYQPWAHQNVEGSFRNCKAETCQWAAKRFFTYNEALTTVSERLSSEGMVQTHRFNAYDAAVLALDALGWAKPADNESSRDEREVGTS